jgi:methyltransferase-like protein
MMVDPVTEQILMEAEVIDAINKIVSAIQGALKSRNPETLKKIAKNLPRKKSFPEIEKEAMRKLPGFKENYIKAQREMIKNKEAKGIERPAALVTAVAATITKHDTKFIADKLSDAARDSKKLFFPGDVLIVKLILFSLFVLAVFATEGAVIGSLFRGLVSAIALIFSVIRGGVEMLQNPPESAWDLIF